jgi:hypothetical protein
MYFTPQLVTWWREKLKQIQRFLFIPSVNRLTLKCSRATSLYEKKIMQAENPHAALFQMDIVARLIA